MSSSAADKERHSYPVPWDAPGAWEPFRMMRDILRWDPFRETELLAPWSSQGFGVRIDVKETREAIEIRADLPGMKEKDIDISVTGNRLILSGDRRAEEKREGESYHSYERFYGSFARTFVLPREVDVDKVQAELKDGVLTMMLPKKPEAKTKQIQIRTR